MRENLHHPRIRRKRKLVDYQQELSDSTSVTMKKLSDHAPNTTRVSQIRPLPSASKPEPLQFFVRLISGGNTIVLHAKSDDLVESVHRQITKLTGIPFHEQRLIYSGKQLEHDKKLEQYSIQNDGSLHLVGRMRSTGYPEPWKVVNDIVSSACRLCKGECLECYRNEVKYKVMKFLALISKDSDELNKEPDKNEDEKHLESLAAKYSNFTTKGNCRFYEIFKAADVPKALVLLFLSPFKGNKECATESIRCLLTPNLELLPKWTQFNCIPIILELCKLLRGNDLEDLLYTACRSTLGSLLNSIGLGFNHRSRYFDFAKPPAIIRDFFPFVRELATKMVVNLELSSNSALYNYKGVSLAENVRDFIAFLRPVCRTIEGHVGAVSQLPIDVRHPCYMDEIKFLSVMLLELLKKINQTLVQVENTVISKGAVRESQSLPIDWDQYIPIMKELSSMGKLYRPVKDALHVIMRKRRLSINYLIRHIKQNGGSYDHHWLFGFKDVMDFESRRHLVMMMLPDTEYEYDELHEMLIDRSKLLEVSFAYITRARRGSFRNGLLVEFKNEEATGPGVLREWFYLVCQAIFNPQNPLFLACPNDHRRFYPNPASKVDRRHLDYFGFCGRVIALALMNKVHVGIVFDRVFFVQLAGNSVSLEDVRDADPCLYMSCKKILEMDAEFVDSDALGLTFVREIEELGSRTVVELKPGGKEIIVNSKNREEYVNLLIRHRFVISISNQVASFAQGFADILSDSSLQRLFFQSLELEDFDRMLHGNDNAICTKEWRAHTDYHGYRETDLQICWFWKVIEGMSTEQQRLLLFFWTSVKYLPIDGFRGLPSRLQISKASNVRNRLPSSQTCFYSMSLPPYSSLTAMRNCLHFISQEHVSRSFGVW